MALLAYSSSPPPLPPLLRLPSLVEALFRRPFERLMPLLSILGDCGTASLRGKATLTVDYPATGGADHRGGSPTVLLEVKDLKAVVRESGQEILRGVSLTINEGEVHAIMGKNGSGKSTFSKVLVGHPDYEVTGGSVLFKDQNLLDMELEERSHVGLFMSFQTPVEIHTRCKEL